MIDSYISSKENHRYDILHLLGKYLRRMCYPQLSTTFPKPILGYILQHVLRIHLKFMCSNRLKRQQCMIDSYISSKENHRYDILHLLGKYLRRMCYLQLSTTFPKPILGYILQHVLRIHLKFMCSNRLKRQQCMIDSYISSKENHRYDILHLLGKYL